MNFATMVFGAFVFFFLWRGYQKGFIGSITRIVSWLIAYPAAIYLTNPVAKLIVKFSPLDGMMVYFIAGSMVFLLVSFSVSKILMSLSDSEPAKNVNKEIDKKSTTATSNTSNTSKISGAVVGCIFGGILGLLAVYAIDLTQPQTTIALQNAAQNTPPQNSNREETFYIPENAQPTANKNAHDKSSPQASTSIDSLISISAKKLVSTAAATAVDLTLNDTAATHLTKAFAENPQSMLSHIQQLAHDGHIKTLLADPAIQELLNKGDTQALIGNQDFQNLMNNVDMQAILANVGDDTTAKTSPQITAEKMVTAWARTQAIKNDPRVIAIITDPEFQQQLNATNKLPLLSNPKLKTLTELIFNNSGKNSPDTQAEIVDHNASSNTPQVTPENSNQSLENKPQKIYQWKDEQGKTHYSDKDKQ